ncbi:hypothetical protein [Ligilactobacillus apodemi]|uniref:hypothetical protein n=1 Tax=Ligilactobacillus apodemi TaxID=307126 RepID=UPI00214C05A8|nr:hypothetical protein [Ligilactobacillus apodemi]MCR1900875.1 hypothetical protein [Ligilactobacillus apodemi]
MARIYRLLVDAYEYAYFDSKIREFVYKCNEEDSRYIKDFWNSWEDTAKNAYIEIDNIDRLVCDRFPTEVAKHMKDMLVKEAEVIELPPGQKAPEYKDPYRKTEYVSYTFEDMGMKDPRDLGKS